DSATLQSRAENLFRAFEPAAKCARVATEFGRRLFLRSALENAQHDRIAKAVGQPGEFFVEYAELIGQVDAWLALLEIANLRRGGCVAYAAARGPSHLSRDASGHADQPPADRPGGTHRLHARREHQERGLERIVGRVRSDQPPADSVDDRPVP